MYLHKYTIKLEVYINIVKPKEESLKKHMVGSPVTCEGRMICKSLKDNSN